MKKNRKDEIMQPGPDLLMSIDVARKVGMAFYHAGKSRNDLLGYFGNDPKSANCRQALGVYEQLKQRYDENIAYDDDRSSEEHNEEADRLESLAAKEKDPKVKAKLESRAEFHREEVGLDSVAASLRMDSDLRTYAFEKLTSNLAELKSRADKVFATARRQVADKADDDDCDDEEAEADAGTGRTVR